MTKKTEQELGFKRQVLDYNAIRQLLPALDGKPELVATLSRWLNVDKVNQIHDRNCDTPGVPFTAALLRDLNVKLDIANSQVLDHLPEGGFITVSNHPLGALDGIALIKMVGEHRSDFKVMVNMVLNYIGAMRPNFINVDALASNDPAKRAVSMRGIADAMRHVKEGHPLGFFPAGAVSKMTWGLRIEDREWQPSIMRIIAKVKVPVIPIYFHGHNSLVFTLLGMIDWRLRTLRLPSEVFHHHDKSIRVSIGDPIMPEEQAAYATPEVLGKFLRERTYSMRKWQNK